MKLILWTNTSAQDPPVFYPEDHPQEEGLYDYLCRLRELVGNGAFFHIMELNKFCLEVKRTVVEDVVSCRAIDDLICYEETRNDWFDVYRAAPAEFVPRLRTLLRSGRSVSSFLDPHLMDEDLSYIMTGRSYEVIDDSDMDAILDDFIPTFERLRYRNVVMIHHPMNGSTVLPTQ